MAGDQTSRAMSVLAPVEQAGGGVLRRMLVIAIDGTTGLPSARVAAARELDRRGEHEGAIDAIIRQHVGLAGAQGLLTSIGGLFTIAVSLPANMAGMAVLQMRLVAAVAHLRGYDVDDPRVRSAVMMTLLGPEPGEDLPSSPLLVATAPVFDASLDRRISEAVLQALLTSIGGRRAATMLGRRVPGLGGAVGLAVDGWSARATGHYARTVFVARRPVR